jgi:hypothetical protein
MYVYIRGYTGQTVSKLNPPMLLYYIEIRNLIEMSSVVCLFKCGDGQTRGLHYIEKA